MTILTPRQAEILPLLTHSNQQIALRLGISQQTVKNHLTAIYRKLLGYHQKRDEGTARVLALTTALREGIIWTVEPGPKRHSAMY